MVNEPATTAKADRRERPRDSAEPSSALGVANLNPFGDLHTMQHLSARLARSLRGVFEPLLRAETRVWAEPLVVQRFADYRAERPEGLTAWVPLKITPGTGRALAVLDAGFVLEMLDRFFGGPGVAPAAIPNEFSATAEMMAARVARQLAAPLTVAWEPLVRLGFEAGNVEVNASMLADLDADDAMVVTRFGIAAGDGEHRRLDLVYPVAALKPHTLSLTGKVHTKSAEPEPEWRNGITRAVMAVQFPVRSVLAEPVISLARLMELKEGDVIPISFGPEVPVMIGTDRFGAGTVGTSNGRAAIRLNSIVRINEEDFR
ncbi:flagellar motor switch protein FliM [Hephaestia caeni]|uniref:Flagellar motor switch protein FliM n=1 Tax=Hephaestia caeni TaxID=645617 RepID=A0A397P4Q1_9SPHN|nr:flagellar motor switch protein FliM [Hephaestia caeni]RIA44520.1 flagellar motor switch protein FliM [Hephaestia caeni]